jgi:bifunctional UDP-N-acetylglucosamine pyrophosphorylase / glucosamine-1-phosphate N-acetyltransferase
MKLLDVIVLAAGHGKRMHSTLPKVLHKLAGKPLLQYIVETVQGLQPHEVYVVYGNGGGQVPKYLSHLAVNWVKQEELLGTGHAVAQAIPEIKQDDNHILILLGDTPLVSLATLQKLIKATKNHQIGLITFNYPTSFWLRTNFTEPRGKSYSNC